MLTSITHQYDLFLWGLTPLFSQGYRIIYLIRINNIFIITIVHGSRNLSNIENQPWNNDQ